MKPKIAPRGTFALAHNRPLCVSIIDRQIDSPSPDRLVSCFRTPRTRAQEPAPLGPDLNPPPSCSLCKTDCSQIHLPSPSTPDTPSNEPRVTY
jgi:hypothetical protein